MSQPETPDAIAAALSDGDSADLSTVSAEDFASLIASASDEQLAAAMSGPGREAALREIFRRMAEHVDPQRARGHEAVVHFQIRGRPDGGYDHFEVVVHDGQCTVSDTPGQEPRVTVKLGAVDFLKLITNQASGPGLFMTGKLKLEGDLMFATQITSFFRIPTAQKQEGSS